MSRSWQSLVAVLLVLGTCAIVQATTPSNRALSSTDVQLLDKPTGTPVPADPNVIRQGGDTCADATVIGALPYTDTGTTVGYTNDYDEVCNYTGSTSPDVVYSYTPAADTYIDATLCTGTTAYDTKLYIYADSCPNSPPVACNDDSCVSPVFPNAWISHVTQVALTGGTTYYIVVDGYGANSGVYTLEVTEVPPPPPPPACPAGVTIDGQTPTPPDGDWSFATTGQTTSFNYIVYENFAGADMNITDFHWWGLALGYSGGFIPCPNVDAVTFDVRFYNDNAGYPGTEICSYTALSPARTDTTLLYSGYSMYYWELPTLSPACVPTGASWVSIKSLTNADNCTFLWASSPVGNDNASWQYDNTAATWTATGYDRGMCITGIVPVELQSFTAE